VSVSGVKPQYGELRHVAKIADCTKIPQKGKYRYLMPLDDAMREQIAPLAKPYPKRQPVRAGSIDSDATTFHEEEGSANLTPALQEAGL
jgi:hypothetical protein